MSDMSRVVNLRNAYIDAVIGVDGIRTLAVDPRGAGRHRPTALLRAGILGGADFSSASLAEEGGGMVVRDAACALPVERYSGTDMDIYPGVPIYHWPDTAWRIPEGARMGQSFAAGEPFQRVGAYLYGAGPIGEVRFRVILRRGGPGGPPLAERIVRGTEAYGFPTIWVFFDSEGWPPGEYFLEVADTAGDVRWWSSVTDVYPDGCAYLDGHPVPDRDLMFLCGQRRWRRFRCTYRVRLDGPAVLLSLDDCAPPPPKEARAGFEIGFPWVRDGYGAPDVDGAPFTCFVTDKTQYVPIEQFKRFPVAWPSYQSPTDRPAFPGARWIHACGNQGYDCHLSEYEETLTWPLESSRMLMRFAGATLRMAFLPPEQGMPCAFPVFHSSSPQLDTVQNRLYRERSFGMGDGGAGAEWLKWIAPQSCWVGPPRADRLRESLLAQKMDPDGYVWAMRYDGGYPHGLRYGVGPRGRRHYSSNAAYVLGAFSYFTWTRDRPLLEALLPCLRRALGFYFDSPDCRWEDDVVAIVEPAHNGTSRGMASTAYDCLPFGYKCALTNAEVYEALAAMAELETMCGEGGRAREWAALGERLQAGYNTQFWDGAAGRYVGCIDVNGRRHDYGFTFVNIQAMAAGLSSTEQARRIFDWMENQPTATGACDTYLFAIGPRANTLDNQDWWYLGGDKEWPGGMPFGLAFQNGGAFMFLSFYDILARLRHRGVEDAWQRYEAILERYQLPDRLCGGNPLYRGEIDGYQVAASVVFPEAGLVPNAFLYGFLGATAGAEGLCFRPELPSMLHRAGVSGLHYAGAVFDIDIERAGDAYTITAACRTLPCGACVCAGGEAMAALSPGSALTLLPGQHLLVQPRGSQELRHDDLDR